MNEEDIKQIVKLEIERFLWSWHFVAIVMSIIIIAIAITLAIIWAN